MKRDKTRDPKVRPEQRLKKRPPRSRPHPDDPENLRICWRKHTWDRRTHKHCSKCQYLNYRNYKARIKADQVDKWGMPERPQLISKKQWVINARKLFQCFIDCWARDEQNGWYLRKDMLEQLHEIREQAGVMLWTKLRNEFTPQNEITPELEEWLNEPVRRHPNA